MPETSSAGMSVAVDARGPDARGLEWPPRDVRRAARAFPEREPDADNALDRRAARLLFGAPLPHRRRVRDPIVAGVLALSREIGELDDASIREEARRLAPAAFVRRDRHVAERVLALVREAAARTLGLAAHPPQIEAAWKLIRGQFVELDTGEGKTLTAAIASCVAALAGVPTHVVTVNDYLARRDAERVGPLAGFFALRVGVVHGGVPQEMRAHEYDRDLTYCTNKDLVFDYLRDRVTAAGARSAAQLALRRLHARGGKNEPLRLRGLHFAIVDEADSILIDEARTPLILSSARQAGKEAREYLALLDFAASLVADEDFRMQPPLRIPELTASGRTRLEDHATEVLAREEPGATNASVWRVAWAREHYVVQALRAIHVMQRDHQYVVRDGKVVIVDEFTGRLLPDRSWEQGLHQLVEAKEGCALTGVNHTLARLTYQGFFSRYLRLAGMSGTLREVAGETAEVYRVRTVRVEPNRPSGRDERPTLLVATQAAKHDAIVREVRGCLDAGRPVLVGTRSVHASAAIAGALVAAGIAHRVLNALQDAQEAELIAHAGEAGAVTVATNMAGRGTDIPLAPDVVNNGGLHVILTEWHESPRIDRQLYGRCARQGDPGSCRAIVSVEDEIITRYGSGTAAWLMRRWPSGPPAWAVRLLRGRVQRFAEAVNAAQRRETLLRDRQMQTQLAFSGSSE
ncbi:MAG: hypothetical protein GC151_16005 [Betaproteobacteria bacterium]|nr:hypothetical protein [Betaproteobacteria bacterium]